MPSTGEPILEARGYFWRPHVQVPEGCFAPDGAVAGRLAINESGVPRLDLDGHLPALKSEGEGESVDDALIAGILAGTDQTVLLCAARSMGGRSSSRGPSSQIYEAGYAILGRGEFTLARAEPLASGIDLSLRGQEQWLRLGDIRLERTTEELQASYARPQPLAFDLTSGRLELRREIFAPGRSGRHRALSLREDAFLTFSPAKGLSLQDAIQWATRIEDLLVVLTNIEQRLDWPDIRVGEAEWAKLFWERDRVVSDNSAWPVWTSLPALEASFGRIVEAWFQGHDRYGPAFGLYLATRRGKKLYTEHHFVSLVWGLESLHRRRGLAVRNKRLQDKVQRVLGDIERTNDRRWLKGILERTAEPSLAQRLAETLLGLPLGLDRRQVREFSQRCARARNDISHFGEQLPQDGLDAFLGDVSVLTWALDVLYHTLLLDIVGVPHDQIRQCFQTNRGGHLLRSQLSAAGLTKLDIEEPPRV